MTDALLLREQDRREILRLLARHLPDVTAWAYGSRVNGGAHEGSDLDIVLRSPDLSPIPLEELRAFVQALRDSNIPILVEARDWARLPESFQQEIMKNYVVLRETVSEWKFYNLNEFYSFSSGLSKGSEFFGSGYDFVSFKDVFDNFFLPKILSAKVQSTESEREILSVKKGDVFLTRTSETEEELGMSSVALKDYPNATFNGFTKRLRPNKLCKEIIVPQFIGYYFRTKKFRDIITSIASITTRASLNNSMLNTLQIPIPPLHEQKAIASVLSSLDDKIDLLNRQNKTLEAMAEALFRQWFVEEAGEDWEEIAIGELFSISSGKAAKKITDSECYPVYGANGIIGYTHSFLYEEKILLTGRVGTLGNVFRVENERIWPSDNTLVVIPEKYYNFVYFSLKNAKLEEYDVGSTQPLVRQSDIKNIKILIPYDEKLNLFERETENIFQKKNCNNSQIRTLEQLRDTLLPKLMSGEVRVAC